MCEYAEFVASVDIRDGAVTRKFPVRALRLVEEWRALHKSELLENWDRLRRDQPVLAIAPLE